MEEAVVGPSPYMRYRDALARVPEGSVAAVDRLRAQAVSYVWGFQDAGGAVKDTDDSIQFGYAFGVVAARYEWPRESIGSRPSIPEAWQSWQEHGEIRAWDGVRLDVVPGGAK